MKKSLIIVLLFCMNIISKADELPFKMEALYSDFKSSLVDANNVLIYGTNGIILKSKDSLKTWKQINIDNGLDILALKNQSGVYYGICDENKIFAKNNDKLFFIKSLDKGDTWEIFPISKNDKIMSVDLGEKSIFITYTSQIKEFDYSFNLIKTHSNFNFTSQIEKSILIDSIRILIYNNLKFYVYNLQKDTIEKKSDITQLPGCNKCKKVEDINVFKNDTTYNIVCLIEKNLYIAKNLGPDWSFNPINILDSSKIAFIDGKILLLTNRINNYNKPMDFITRICTFDKFAFEKTNKFSFDRMVAPNIVFTQIFKFNSNLVAIGNDKSIFQSPDTGKTWKVISNCKVGIIKAISNKLIYSIYFDVSNKDQIVYYSSMNSGITWLPFQTDSLSLESNFTYPSIDFNENGKGIIADLSSPFHYQYDYFEITSLDSKAYYLGDNNTKGDLQSIRQPAYIRMMENNGYIFVNNLGYLKNNASFKYSIIDFLDSNFKIIKSDTLDAVNIWDIHKKNDSLFMLVSKYYNPQYDSNTTLRYYDSINTILQIKSFKDLSLKNQKKLNITYSYNSVNNSHFSNNRIFYYIPSTNGESSNLQVNDVYCYYDIEKEKFNTVLENDAKTNFNSLYNMINLNDDIYFSYKTDLYKVNPDNSYSKIWLTDFNNIFQFNGGASFGNIGYSSVSAKIDSHYTNVLYKLIAPVKTNVGNSTEISNYFYYHNPYPLPAKNVVNCNIYWEINLNINTASISVYNFMGDKIESNENIVITSYSDWEGLLTWNCKNQASGIYFINIQYGNTNKSIPVMINH